LVIPLSSQALQSILAMPVIGVDSTLEVPSGYANVKIKLWRVQHLLFWRRDRHPLLAHVATNLLNRHQKVLLGSPLELALVGVAYPLLRTRWDLHANSAALSGRALDPKPPAHVCDALAHRLQAEVSRERTRRIEALTIVANLQEDLVRLLLQVQLHSDSRVDIKDTPERASSSSTVYTPQRFLASS
jgi:hypothetical protein